METESLVIYSCYVSPAVDEEELQRYLIELKRDMRKKKKEVLIGGDLNSKAYSWGSPIEDKKGRTVMEWINSEDLCILNKGNIPTFERTNGSSFIDITVCTPGIERLIEKWCISKEENLSYHKNIYVNIKENKAKEEPLTRNENQKKG